VVLWRTTLTPDGPRRDISITSRTQPLNRTRHFKITPRPSLTLPQMFSCFLTSHDVRQSYLVLPANMGFPELDDPWPDIPTGYYPSHVGTGNTLTVG
jgi:hypothetical protein